jgi:hypothetical protein
MRALEELSAHEVTGAGDIVGFLSIETGMMPEAVGERLNLARQLDTLQDTVARLAEGEISFDTATLVARSTAKMRPAQVAEVEAGILEMAGKLSPGRLRQHAAVVVAKADAKPLNNDAERARERREVKFGPDEDGLVRLSGHLTSLCAAEVRAALEPYMKPADGTDRRSAGQRRHDALHQLGRNAGAGTGDEVAARRGRRPQVVIVAGLEAVMGQAGSVPLLQGRVPLTQAEFDAALDDADISVALTNAKGNVVFAGRSARSFSAAKMRAMAAASPYCAFEGCTRASVECAGHHVVEYALGGETVSVNGAPLCFVHHERVHRDGWWVGPDAAGGWRTLPPKHEDNPRNRVDPDEYRRIQREAMLRRGKQHRPRGSEVGAGRAP